MPCYSSKVSMLEREVVAYVYMVISRKHAHKIKDNRSVVLHVVSVTEYM